MTDSLFGLVGKDYVLICADSSVARSIVVMKEGEDKILALDKFKLLGASGPVGDRTHFCEYVQKNVHLYELRNNISLSVKAAANWTRNELAEALRKGPYQVNLLLGGYDKNGASLYFMDYLAACDAVPYGAHGYASYFLYSVFDRYYKKDMSLEEGLDLVKRCINELRTRFLINNPSFILKISDKDGIRELSIPGEKESAKAKEAEQAKKAAEEEKKEEKKESSPSKA